jgi:hypothetical protein
MELPQPRRHAGNRANPLHLSQSPRSFAVVWEIDTMLKIAAAAILALVACSACLTDEDLECWYDDMCMTMHADTKPPAPASGAGLHESR